MSDHKKQTAPQRGKVLEALAQAERRVFTRPAPKPAKAQVKFLLTGVQGSTKTLAERLASRAARWRVFTTTSFRAWRTSWPAAP